MKRKIENTLQKWSEKERHLPLMLIGARQTGKTYVLRDFVNSAGFENIVEINFYEKADYKDFFVQSLNPQDIVRKIELYFQKLLPPEKTIFFFDEIQDCEQAIASLKFFAEVQEQYHIVCAGSLPGVKINRLKSPFPVGKVQIEYLFPMDFEEFLWAINQKMLADEIRNCFDTNTSLSTIIHQKALDIYKQYLCIGGMPAALADYIKNDQNLVKTDTSIISDIITGYLADMTKYSENINSLKINNVFNSIPAQLAKEKHKFQYKLIEINGKKEKYETAIEWLLQAGILLKVQLVTKPQIPLLIDENHNSFKLYLLDVGIFNKLAGIKFADILQNEKFNYLGAITETFVAQQLTANRHKLYFWNSGNTAEVDYLLHTEDGIIPCEVKADKNVGSKSLSVYVERHKPKYSIRISAKNFGFDNNIKSTPLYGAFCL
ncbi:MAG: ATP-binding protein [Prevotellaceae bacterium]|jgi:predicted AAA+ superfamily ATPase|nr:ATP-binding protein [Prevotellaceae bacterium]